MVCGKLKSHVFVFCPFSWSVTSLSFLLWLKISGCVFRSCFACLWFCSFVRLLKISGCVFCFWVLLFCQVAKFFRLWFFSVSFFFLRLCLSFLFLFFFSVCGFLFFGSLLSGCGFLCQAVVLFFCSLLFSGCGFGSVFLSCVLCSCQAVFSCLVPFVFVRWLNFLGCGLAVFCFSCFSQVVMFCFVLAEMLRLWSLGLFFLFLLYRVVEIFRLWLLVLFCFLSYSFSFSGCGCWSCCG